jgi:hypothetical protein
VATYQYRYVVGLDSWAANSGNALLAIVNKPNSGKRLVIKSVEFVSMLQANNATAGTITSAVPSKFFLQRGATISGGVPVTLSVLDTDASMPSSARVLADSNVSGSPQTIRSVVLAKNAVPAGLNWYVQQQLAGQFGGIYRGARGADTSFTEPVIIRAGETLSLSTTANMEIPFPMRVSVVLVKQGTPNRTFSTSYITYARTANTSVFSFVNDAGSGEVYELKSLSISEIGQFDTPYIQIVPVGSANPDSLADPTAAAIPMKMDSNYPDASTWVYALKDAAILPYGLPETALSDASAGSPKGSNYLKAKDFIGPVWRVMFPEFSNLSTLRMPDSLHHNISHSNSDLLFRNAGVTLREGDGLAIVSAAESAAIATAVAVSGYQSWFIAVTVDVAAATTPSLILTGLKNPSEVRIFEAGTTTELAGQENITSGTFSWQYDPESVTSVDIAILSLGHLNIRLTGQALGVNDITIPIQQQIDRQYQNA